MVMNVITGCFVCDKYTAQAHHTTLELITDLFHVETFCSVVFSLQIFNKRMS